MSDFREKVVQFGTGAFLRGFVEYFIDEANRTGDFGGSVVAISSTPSGRDQRINEQHGRYSLAIRGICNGDARDLIRPIGSLSRAIPASTEWEAVLECARNPDIELIFSNTTETGIRLDETDLPGPNAPASFPGKLTAFLHERAQHFEYASTAAPVVIPCELIENNGDTLRRIVMQLASRWQMGRQFERWMDDVVFCNTLVDRIVPGELSGDETVIACEPYRLFAIAAPASARARLSFANADPNVILCDDVTPYRERKVRLLNGAHTIMVPAALQAGCTTVREAMEDDVIGDYARRVLFDELVQSTSVEGACEFAQQTVDRFRNPYINHALLDITLQQTMKMRVRVVPAIRDYVTKFGVAPRLMAFGFAAYLSCIVLRTDLKPDDQAEAVRAEWEGAGNGEQFVRRVCGLTELWGTDLAGLADFADIAAQAFRKINDVGIRGALA